MNHATLADRDEGELSFSLLEYAVLDMLEGLEQLPPDEHVNDVRARADQCRFALRECRRRTFSPHLGALLVQKVLQVECEARALTGVEHASEITFFVR